MRKIYEKEWFGIKFKSFTKIDSNNPANASFYDKFYDCFYENFSSYEGLPAWWKAGKESVANLILEHTDPDDRLISIGCGNGYIEYILSRNNLTVTAVEPSIKSVKFLKQFSNVKVHHGYFPQCLSKTESNSFDAAYIGSTDYVFSKKELVDLLIEIKKFGLKKILLVSSSFYHRTSYIHLIKYCIKSVLGYLKLYESGQFWGYSRTPDEFIQAFTEAGFNKVQTGYIKDYFWIKGQNNKNTNDSGQQN